MFVCRDLVRSLAMTETRRCWRLSFIFPAANLRGRGPLCLKCFLRHRLRYGFWMSSFTGSGINSGVSVCHVALSVRVLISGIAQLIQPPLVGLRAVGVTQLAVAFCRVRIDHRTGISKPKLINCASALPPAWRRHRIRQPSFRLISGGDL